MQMTMEQFEKLTSRPGTKIFQGTETKLDDGTVRQPVKIVRRGFRPVVGVVVFKPEEA